MYHICFVLLRSRQKCRRKQICTEKTIYIWMWLVWFCLFLSKIFETSQGIHAKFSPPKPMSICKNLRWFGPKMTELEPFSRSRSKFLKTSLLRRIANIRHFGGNLNFSGTGPILGDGPHFFLLPFNCLHFWTLPCFTPILRFLGRFEGADDCPPPFCVK